MFWHTPLEARSAADEKSALKQRQRPEVKLREEAERTGLTAVCRNESFSGAT